MSSLRFLHQSLGGRGVATHPLCFKDDDKVKVHSEVKEHSLTKMPLSV